MIKRQIASYRFLLLILHLITIGFVLLSYEDILNVSLRIAQSDSYKSYNHKTTELRFFIGMGISVFCGLFELIGLFIGYSIHYPLISAIQIMCHFWGLIYFLILAMKDWPYHYFWYFFPFISLCPFICEIVAYVELLALKKIKF